MQEQDFLTVDKAVWFSGRDSCTLSVSDGTPLAMTVDVSFDTRIAMGFVVTNNQTAYAGSNTGIDDTQVQIETAEVSFTYTGGAAPDSFEVTLPQNTIAGGEQVAFLIQVPTEIAAGLRGSLAAGDFENLEMSVVFVGRRSGQSGNSKLGEVRTPAYIYPFEVCSGCLVDCNECGVCPEQTAFVGTCGFAQGLPVYHPVCDAESTTTDTGTDTGP